MTQALDLLTDAEVRQIISLIDSLDRSHVDHLQLDMGTFKLAMANGPQCAPFGKQQPARACAHGLACSADFTCSRRAACGCQRAQDPGQAAATSRLAARGGHHHGALLQPSRSEQPTFCSAR